MGLRLDRVIPWGRSLDEYIKMFDLQPDDLKLTILDCAGGPASFNAEMTRQAYNVISCDPVYQFSAAEIAERIEDTYPIVLDGVRAASDSYVWENIRSPEELGDVRMAAMKTFLEDFPAGFQKKRYLAHGLPVLPFNNNEFDLALCSHFLFSYSEQLSEEFHVASILEMSRVAKEVRIFPLLDISGEVSPFLEPIMNKLANNRFTVEIRRVPYQFQKGGNQMLRVCLPR